MNCPNEKPNDENTLPDGPDFDKWKGVGEAKRTLVSAIAESILACAKEHPEVIWAQFCCTAIAGMCLYFSRNALGISGAVAMGAMVTASMFVVNLRKENNATSRKRKTKPPPKS